MQVFRNWRWSALAIAFGLASPIVRAEMITPDSIPNPPSAVASAQGTPVSPSNLVNLQYKGLGLVFPGGSAITQLNGVSVWAPVSPPTEISGQSSSRPIDYAWNIVGSLVSPGSLNPTTVSSLALDVIGHVGSLKLSAYGLNGLPIISALSQSSPGPNGGQVFTFTGPGINSFSVSAVLPPPGSAQPATTTSPWGVAGISFTPATTPEPSSLVLAGLGALGLAARLGWRRTRRVARPVVA